MNNNQQDSGLDSVSVRRGKFDSLSLYEVTESELQDLERGGPASLLLNFAIFLLSVAISFSVSLFSTKIDSLKTFCVFVIVTVLGYISGVILMLVWNQSRLSTKSIVTRIKDRMPKDNPVDNDSSLAEAVDKE